MREDIVHHIGFIKTGTTFLQDIIFPRLKGITYNKAPINYKDIIFRDKINFEKQSLQPGLYSLEHLSGWVEDRFCVRSEIIDKLHLNNPSAKIILVIRRQDSFAKSVYLQTIKAGSTISLKRFYKFVFDEDYYRASKFLTPNKDYFFYYRYISYMISKFGRSNVLVLPFELLKENHSKFLERICTFLNVNVPSYRNQVMNQSIGYLRSLLFRFLNHFFITTNNPNGFIRGYIPYYSARRQRLAFTRLRNVLSTLNLLTVWDRFWNFFDFKYKDGTGTCKTILDMCKAGNKKLDKKYHLGLKKYGYY